jgi:hypothetical protein
MMNKGVYLTRIYNFLEKSDIHSTLQFYTGADADYDERGKFILEKNDQSLFLAFDTAAAEAEEAEDGCGLEISAGGPGVFKNIATLENIREKLFFIENNFFALCQWLKDSPSE